MEQAERRELLVSRTWMQAVILVILVGFFILGLLAYRQYMEHPPVPDARRRRAAARCCSPAMTSPRARRCSCTTA